MTVIVNFQEARTQFSQLLDRAHEGEEIVVAKAGKPYARLVPLSQAARPSRQPGRLAGQTDDSDFFEPLPASELDAWDASA